MNTRAFILLSTAFSLCALPAFAATSVMEFIPGGTHVPVHVVGQISSSSAKVADTFTIAADEDVVINGRIVIEKGAEGAGEVASVNKARGSGHSGSLGIKFDWIYAVDGGKIRLAQTAQSRAEADRKGASSTATIVGVAALGLGGLFGHNLARGKDITLDDSKSLTAFTADNIHVATNHLIKRNTEHFDK